MASALMSSKGQIVIPAELRRRADLHAGDRVEVELDDLTGELRLRKAEAPDVVVQRLADKFTAWVKPGTKPLEDPGAFYRAREPK